MNYARFQQATGCGLMNETASTNTGRIEALEIKLSHLERAMSEINDVVIRQQKDLEVALARQQRLRDQLSVLEAGIGAGTTAEEKPPHY